jgi:hypothetical protein
MQSLFSPRSIRSRRPVAAVASPSENIASENILTSSADVSDTDADGIVIVRRFTRARAAAETRRER